MEIEDVMEIEEKMQKHRPLGRAKVSRILDHSKHKGTHWKQTLFICLVSLFKLVVIAGMLAMRILGEIDSA